MARDVERALLELGDFARVEPPAFLDQLVHQRMGTVLEQRRGALAPPSLRQQTSGEQSWQAEPSAARGTGLGRAEAWVYAFGFLAYGAQVADGLARLIWHALSG
jgi:hypothetical protein